MNPKTCVLGQLSLEILSHCVTSAGVCPLLERVQHITDFPRPQSTKSLKEFLGMLNFYRRFVPQAPAIILPLYDLVNVKDHECEASWTALCEDHFQRSKLALATATGLTHLTAEASINTYASDTAVGAVQQQFLRGVWTPLSFFSHKLLPAGKKYSTFDKELLAPRDRTLRYSLTIKHLRSCSTKYPISGPHVNSDISVVCRNSLPIYATFREMTM